ncbi:Apyrase precursor, putative [Entamoeba dispar SAW760]|uniref:Apyrase, putative n=1 Tax=Entamoeba dispar (strain ATCC PRA-260 / SAW760) TaxID=370354 RepID=B0EEC6_ENTDS|nr:Apyrase precursor, putative [Entamoeba dispar SAW760]EDR27110.1 Apyrase precursor, putative [Entamoeba dispar SAW760]|eukprot:EDR27110.1 Apyrase precursor, putative [Entamoeba dispar SAW760]
MGIFFTTEMKVNVITMVVVLSIIVISTIGFVSVITGLSIQNTFKYPIVLDNYQSYEKEMKSINIGMISDDDELTKYGNDYYCQIYLGKIHITDKGWEYEETSHSKFISKFNKGKRGNELSELVWYNKKLYGFDDKTGIGYEINIDRQELYPRIIFNEGNGSTESGMKVEWGTVYNDEMIVGSQGNIHVNGIDDYSNSYIYHINTQLEKRVESWIDKYERINKVLNISYPGYITNEGILYSNMYHEWYIFPRKVSKIEWIDELDEIASSQYIIICDEDINVCRKYKDPQYVNERCFSSIKILPFNERTVIYTKSVEHNGKIESYIGAISLDGVNENENVKIVMKDTLISKYKIEGIEVLPNYW